MAGLGRTTVRPGNNYAQQMADAESTYNASMTPPATSYVTTRTGLTSNQQMPAAQAWTGAPFVSHRWRRNGQHYAWAWGAIDMHPFKTPPTSGPDSGQVNSSDFQTKLVQLHDWQTNDNWYICYPAATVMFGSAHNLGLSFRTEQLPTQTTGGSWHAYMTPRNRYTKVQKVPRYNATPKYYNTKSAKG